MNQSDDLQDSLNRAIALARSRNDGYVTGEHLVYGLLTNVTLAPLLKRCQIDTKELGRRLLLEMDQTSPLPGRSAPSREPSLTTMVQRVILQANRHAQTARRAQTCGMDLLLALLEQEESVAVFLLHEQNLDLVTVKSWIATGKLPAEDGMGGEEPSAATGKSALEQYAVHLNKEAESGKIDALIGREHEVERVVQILCRRKKNNPLLVGDPGVGKTAIAEGLAWRIVKGEVPSILKDAQIYSLAMGTLVAGAKYRGDFEKRITALLDEVAKNPNIVLFIDEIHTMIGAGAASGGAMDASNLLKPALSSGKVRVIGSTTFQEYREIFERDQALARRFQKIDVKEPTQNEAVEILKGLRSHYEKHHNVVFTDEALLAAVELSVRYMSNRLLPDKAIDLIDEAGARQRVLGKPEEKAEIGRAEIAATVSSITQVPAEQVSETDRNALAHLETGLQSLIFGQDPAISSVVKAIKMSRAGLRDENKPIASVLFAGPTGVGKTEVTRQLAKQLGIELLRFDMSEYMEPHSVARLIGAPPGYVGFNKGGLLTEMVNKHPHAVLLLDEIEKAHPDINNILLQVMDHGMLTDTTGRTVDFRNVILVLTTNAGASIGARRSMGFTQQDHTTDAMEAIKKAFAPEFRNRLDRIVQFAPLGNEEVLRVVRKNLSDLSLMLLGKGVTLQFEDSVAEWLAQKGFDPTMGARPLARIIDDQIKQPLSDELLFGGLANGGGVVHIDCVNDELVIKTTANPVEIPEDSGTPAEAV